MVILQTRKPGLQTTENAAVAVKDSMMVPQKIKIVTIPLTKSAENSRTLSLLSHSHEVDIVWDNELYKTIVLKLNICL